MITIGTCLLSVLACSQGYLSPVELTVTAAHSPIKKTRSAEMQPVSASKSPITTPTQKHITLTDEKQFAETHTPQPDISTSTHTNLTQIPLLLYNTQTGDSLTGIAGRFGISKDQISARETISQQSFLPPGILLMIPDRLEEVGPALIFLPDSEVINSPSTIDFDVQSFVNEAGGYLSSYREYRSTGWHSGAELVEMAALDNSINPRLLLALIENQSHWVFGQPSNMAETDYPLGWIDLEMRGLADQLNWAIQQISLGYYGWRSGEVTEVTFIDKSNMHMAPELNAGTAALQYFYSKIYNREKWLDFFGDNNGFQTYYESRFGNPWLRAHHVEPLFPDIFTQPVLELPFPPGHSWNFTGGPHPAWGQSGAWAALDFAPVGIEDCSVSSEWITASAPGFITRSENGFVILDLDGDGFEQTGWALLYLHVATQDRVAAGSYINKNEPIGHPSCEGGRSTGTHVHIARKYNGEWMQADGPIPFVLSGWRAYNGNNPYEGTLSKNDQIIRAHEYSSFDTIIYRPIQEDQ